MVCRLTDDQEAMVQAMEVGPMSEYSGAAK